MCLLSPGAPTVSWAKDVNSKISTALIYVSPPHPETVSAPFQDQFDNFPFPASSEKLRMEASQAIGSANSTVIVGVLIIIVGTIAAAAVFTSKRTRAKMRHVQQIRYVVNV